MFTLGDVADVLDGALDTGISIIDTLAKLSDIADEGSIDRNKCFSRLQITPEDINNNNIGAITITDSTDDGINRLQNYNNNNDSEENTTYCDNSFEDKKQLRKSLFIDKANDGELKDEIISTGNGTVSDTEVATGTASMSNEGDVINHESINTQTQTTARRNQQQKSDQHDQEGDVNRRKRVNRRTTFVLDQSPVRSLEEATAHGIPIIEALGDLCSVADNFLKDYSSKSASGVATGGNSSIIALDGSVIKTPTSPEDFDFLISSKVNEILSSFQQLDSAVDLLKKKALKDNFSHLKNKKEIETLLPKDYRKLLDSSSPEELQDIKETSITSDEIESSTTIKENNFPGTSVEIQSNTPGKSRPGTYVLSDNEFVSARSPKKIDFTKQEYKDCQRSSCSAEMKPISLSPRKSCFFEPQSPSNSMKVLNRKALQSNSKRLPDLQVFPIDVDVEPLSSDSKNNVDTRFNLSRADRPGTYVLSSSSSPGKGSSSNSSSKQNSPSKSSSLNNVLSPRNDNNEKLYNFDRNSRSGTYTKERSPNSDRNSRSGTYTKEKSSLVLVDRTSYTNIPKETGPDSSSSDEDADVLNSSFDRRTRNGTYTKYPRNKNNKQSSESSEQDKPTTTNSLNFERNTNQSGTYVKDKSINPDHLRESTKSFQRNTNQSGTYIKDKSPTNSLNNTTAAISNDLNFQRNTNQTGTYVKDNNTTNTSNLDDDVKTSQLQISRFQRNTGTSGTYVKEKPSESVVENNSKLESVRDSSPRTQQRPLSWDNKNKETTNSSSRPRTYVLSDESNTSNRSSSPSYSPKSKSLKETNSYSPRLQSRGWEPSPQQQSTQQQKYRQTALSPTSSSSSPSLFDKIKILKESNSYSPRQSPIRSQESTSMQKATLSTSSSQILFERSKMTSEETNHSPKRTNHSPNQRSYSLQQQQTQDPLAPTTKIEANKRSTFRNSKSLSFTSSPVTESSPTRDSFTEELDRRSIFKNSKAFSFTSSSSPARTDSSSPTHRERSSSTTDDYDTTSNSSQNSFMHKSQSLFNLSSQTVSPSSTTSPYSRLVSSPNQANTRLASSQPNLLEHVDPHVGANQRSRLGSNTFSKLGMLKKAMSASLSKLTQLHAVRREISLSYGALADIDSSESTDNSFSSQQQSPGDRDGISSRSDLSANVSTVNLNTFQHENDTQISPVRSDPSSNTSIADLTLRQDEKDKVQSPKDISTENLNTFRKDDEDDIEEEEGEDTNSMTFSHQDVLHAVEKMDFDSDMDDENVIDNNNDNEERKDPVDGEKDLEQVVPQSVEPEVINLKDKENNAENVAPRHVENELNSPETEENNIESGRAESDTINQSENMMEEKVVLRRRVEPEPFNRNSNGVVLRQKKGRSSAARRGITNTYVLSDAAATTAPVEAAISSNTYSKRGTFVISNTNSSTSPNHSEGIKSSSTTTTNTELQETLVYPDDGDGEVSGNGNSNIYTTQAYSKRGTFILSNPSSPNHNETIVYTDINEIQRTTHSNTPTSTTYSKRGTFVLSNTSSPSHNETLTRTDNNNGISRDEHNSNTPPATTTYSKRGTFVLSNNSSPIHNNDTLIQTDESNLDEHSNTETPPPPTTTAYSKRGTFVICHTLSPSQHNEVNSSGEAEGLHQQTQIYTDGDNDDEGNTENNQQDIDSSNTIETPLVSLKTSPLRRQTTVDKNRRPRLSSRASSTATTNEECSFLTDANNNWVSLDTDNFPQENTEKPDPPTAHKNFLRRKPNIVSSPKSQKNSKRRGNFSKNYLFKLNSLHTVLIERFWVKLRKQLHKERKRETERERAIKCL